MEDLTKIFNKNLTTEEIRELIKYSLKMTDEDYFCYKCFKFLGRRKVNAELCKICYQYYCEKCAPMLYKNSLSKEIDPYKCLQCLETRNAE